jgi:hypothetical protein
MQSADDKRVWEALSQVPRAHLRLAVGGRLDCAGGRRFGFRRVVAGVALPVFTWVLGPRLLPVVVWGLLPVVVWGLLPVVVWGLLPVVVWGLLPVVVWGLLPVVVWGLLPVVVWGLLLVVARASRPMVG